MSKIENGGLDRMALDPSNSSNFDQLVLKGLKTAAIICGFLFGSVSRIKWVCLTLRAILFKLEFCYLKLWMTVRRV